ncbi:MAG: hypothetical protein H7067_04610, partial [Burkholderiales bacterium]|nr:hypothetical protein [Opitutaceae bacterium]
LSPTSFRIVGRGGASTGGATADLWTGTNDSHTYVSLPWQGDGVFTARVVSLDSTDASAKAGLIFRETTDAGSRYSAVYLLRSNGGAVNYQHKTATNGSSTGVNFFNGSSTNRGLPEWIRLVRQGDTFATYHSENGTTWTQLSTARVNILGGSALTVGLCVVPRTGGTEATAVFDNLSFFTPHQLWRQTYFGTTAATGSAAPLADPDGDGLPNLLAYALGRSPLVANAAAPAELDLVQTDESAAPHLTLAFNRIADPTLAYVVEATSDLVTWVPIWTSTGSANQPGEVVVADPVELAPDRPRRFLRLRVTAP